MFKYLLTRLGTFALVAGLAYATVCALMYFGQRSYIYFPAHTRVEAQNTDWSLIREDGATLRGWRVNPGKRDAVLYFGGNAERIEHMRQALSAWLPEHTAYLLAYRGYGASEGRPDEAALLTDGLALFDRVREIHPDGRIDAIGRSLGASVAAHVAGNRPIARLALITPFDSLVSVARHHYPWLPVRWLLRERFESLRHLRAFDGSVLVIVAGRDEIVPARSTNALIDAIDQPSVLRLDDAQHNSTDDDPAFGAAIVAFLGYTGSP